MKKILIKSILAGMMISIGAVTYMNAPPLIGAFMFSIGILTIFQLSLYLFTGLVPYMNKLREIPFTLTVLLGNVIGCCLMFLLPSQEASQILDNKLNDSYLVMFVSAMLCNVMIYIAVEAKKRKNTILIILAIASFILCGFNHSIANVCFVISSRVFTLDAAILVLISVVGNAVGGMLFRKLVEYANSKDREKLYS